MTARLLALAGAVLLAAMTAALAQEPSAELKGLEASAAGHYRAGDYASALEVAERALALTIREFGPEHERVGIQSYGAGLTAEAAGKSADAERHYALSVRVREKVYGPDSAGTAQAVEKLAAVILRQGRTDEAEPLVRRVLKVRTDLLGGDDAFAASAHAALGDVALARGQADAALTSYRRAVRLLTSQKAAQTVVKQIVDADIRRNRDAFAGLAQAAWDARTSPTAGGAEALLAETYAASQQAWATSAASALARMSARIGAGTSELGRRIRDVQDKSERVLALNEEDMRALAEWSQVQRANPAYAAALDEFRQASIAQSRVTQPIARQQKELIQRMQALQQRCQGKGKAQGCERYDAEMQEISRELGALSAEASKGSGAIMAIHARMETAERALPGYEAFHKRREARLAEMQGLERTLTAERAAVTKEFPRYAALAEPMPLTIPETQALLQADEALVTILVGTRSSFVWAISRTRAEWAAIPAGEKDLADDVAQLRLGLDPAGDGQVQLVPVFDAIRAHALYRRILAPVAGVLEGARHVIVVPTGPLTSLPFQVLVTAPPPSGVLGKDSVRATKWLIQKHALSVLPSVQSLAALRTLAPSAAPPKPFIGIGDPVLAGPEGSHKQRGKPPRVAAVYRNGAVNLRALRELVPLPETAQEIRTIAGILGASSEEMRLGPAATETEVKRLRLADYRVVHFATHGLVAGEMSGLDEPALVLTPPATPSEIDDGLLTASEIATLTLGADWVVLSACNTASGNQVGADALSGLARAFFYAGARALLVSHWSVNSDAAVFLTTRTFAGLARGVGRAEAFRQTMLAMVGAGHAPTAWAPFVIVGEGAAGR